MMKKMIDAKIDQLIITDISVKKTVINYLHSLKFKETEPGIYRSILSVVEISKKNSNLIINIYVEEKDNVITSSMTNNSNFLLAIGVSSFVKKIINVIKKTAPNCSIIHSFTLKKSNSLLRNKIYFLLPIILGAIVLTIIIYAIKIYSNS